MDDNTNTAKKTVYWSAGILFVRAAAFFVLLLTLYATAYSGNSLLGYPGEAYRRGFSWIMATGFSAAKMFRPMSTPAAPWSIAL